MAVAASCLTSSYRQILPTIPRSMVRLYENGALEKKNEKSQEPCFYIKVPTLSDQRIQRIYRIAALNRGNTKIVIFDESTKKYSVMKDVLISSEEKVRERLSSVFSSENVVFK